jgi:serine/threonine-protein kinase
MQAASGSLSRLARGSPPAIPAPSLLQCHNIYDFTTEVYFVGKLFEKIIQEHNIEHFMYTHVLAKMCRLDPQARMRGFLDIEKDIESNRFLEIEFRHEEKCSYQQFSDSMRKQVSRIQNDFKYADDYDRVQAQLEDAYRGFMLEDTVPDAASVIGCFVRGEFHYIPSGFPVCAVREFLRLLKSVTHEKRRIVMANLYTRLDSIPRYPKQPPAEDFPF